MNASVIVAFLKGIGVDVFSAEPDGLIHQIDIKDGFKGWYVIHSEGPGELRVTLCDWRTKEQATWFQNSERRKKHGNENEEEISEENSEESRENWRQAALEAKRLYAEGYDAQHPYLLKKKLPHTPGVLVRLNDFGKLDLLIPLKDTQGELRGLQIIEETGDKQFLAGQRTKEIYHQIGSFALNAPLLYLCEGYATGVAVHVATGVPVICAMSSGNLLPMAKVLRTSFPQIHIIVAGDNDKSGILKGREAAAACGGVLSLPQFAVPDTGTDWADLALAEGMEQVTAQLGAVTPPSGVLPITEARLWPEGFHKEIVLANGQSRSVPDLDAITDFYFSQTPHFTVTKGESMYQFTGKLYEENTPLALKHFAEEHFNPKPSNHTIAEFTAKVQRHSVRPLSWLDTSIHKKINLRNGVLHLDTMSVHPHSPDYGFRYVLPFDYTPEATAPIFEETLNRLFFGDKDLCTLLTEFIGYILSGDECWAQKALVMTGEGKNGKSTMLDLIKYVMGGATNYSVLSLAKLSQDYSLQTLDGKLANISEEQPTSTLVDSANFKALVAGGEVEVRAIYKPPYTMRGRAKFIFACNQLPDTTDTTFAFYRRLILVPFDRTFEEGSLDFDGKILDKLKGEAPGVFNLALKAYLIAKQRGKFTESTRSAAIMDEYKELSDVVTQWANNNLADVEGENLPLSEAFNEYAIDCETARTKPLTRNQFTRKMKSLPKYKTRIGVMSLSGKSVRSIRGVKLLR